MKLRQPTKAIALLAAIATTAAFWITFASAAFAQQDKPNVVLMLADNVGWGDIGAFAGGELRGMPTPNIDQLAAEGMQLSQFLVEPACTPSRAALMTGRYSTRVGLNTVIIGGTPNTLQASEVTLAELFKDKGVKYHMNPNPPYALFRELQVVQLAERLRS